MDALGGIRSVTAPSTNIPVPALFSYSDDRFVPFPLKLLRKRVKRASDPLPWWRDISEEIQAGLLAVLLEAPQ